MSHACSGKSADLDRLQDAFDGVEPWTGMVRGGQIANFLGVLTSLDYFTPVDRRRHAYAGPYRAETRPPTISDGDVYFEWLDVFEAVRGATGSFTMIELGAGFAARSVNAHAALQRLNPLPASFVVVEGEPRHFEWARDHFRANGIDPEDHWFVNALVNATGRPELFVLAAGRYCNAILPSEDRQTLFELLKQNDVLDSAAHALLVEGRIDEVIRLDEDYYDVPFGLGFLSGVRLDTILRPLGFVDYMDVDIQFAEISILPDAIEQIEAKVKRLHVGTHSGDIHATLKRMFEERGWAVLFSYEPNATHFVDSGRFQTTDGVLTVLNPRFH